jgi:hypothetical protein
MVGTLITLQPQTAITTVSTIQVMNSTTITLRMVRSPLDLPELRPRQPREPQNTSALRVRLRLYRTCRHSRRDQHPCKRIVGGRTARFANLSIAAGHAMMGMSLGPVTGQLIAEILAGEPPRIDVTQLSPDRYDRR